LHHFVMPGQMWPKSKSLSFTCIDLAAEVFLHLLRIHKDTLKHLELACLSLYGDGYDDYNDDEETEDEEFTGWKYVFEQAQESLCVESAPVRGSLLAGEDVEWN
jgi:hypothetical protein